MRVVGIGDGGDAATAEPEQILAAPCVWWDHGHAHDGHLVDGECGPLEEGHVGGDHDDAGALGFTVDPVELRPAARGEPAPAFAVFHENTGERGGAHMPPATPAVLEWSDWCFFGPEGGAPGGGPYGCSLEMAHFSWALSHLEAEESCVLEQHRLHIEAQHTPGVLPGDALNDFGWHRCPSLIDPDPQPGADWTAGCDALSAADPLVAELVEYRYGDCGAYADKQHRLFVDDRPEWLRAPDCSRAGALEYLWTQAHLEQEYLSAEPGVGHC